PRRVSITSLDQLGTSMTACRLAAEKAGYSVVVRPFQRSPYLDVEGNMTEYESRLSRNLVAGLNKSWRRLGRQGKVSVEIAGGRERLEALLREAFAVEASSWKGTCGTGLSRLEFHGDAAPYKLRWADAVDERKRFEAFSPSPVGKFLWAALAYGWPAAKLMLGLFGTWKQAGT